MKYVMNFRLGTAVLAVAVVGFGFGKAQAQLPDPAADYEFSGDYTSSTPGGTIGALTPIGTGNDTFGTATVNGQTDQVLNITSGGGVQTPASPFTSQGTYSIVLECSISLTLSSTTPSKIFDFKNLASDAGLYVVQTTGFLQFIDDTGTPIVNGTGLSAIPTGTYFQLTLTRTAGGVVTGYQNATQAFQFTDTGNVAVLNTMLSIFKDDNNTALLTGENSGGGLSQLRLYNEVLTPAQVALLAAPEPGTWAMVLIGGGVLWRVAAVRRRRRAAA